MTGLISAPALTTGTITLDASGVTAADTITYSNPSNLSAVSTSTGTRNIVLTGANTGTNTFNGAIANNSGSGGKATLTKNGTGTWVLTGANTYTGATVITQGTLALIGGSGLTQTLTVQNGAKLGFALGSPAAYANTAVAFAAGHAVAVSGAPDGSSSYKLMTAASFSSLPILAPSITGYELQILGGGKELWLVPSTVTPGPVASFTLSPVGSPQTVGTPIAGITITAKDASNNTATGFTGTVTFGGTAGCSGTSANFIAGVLSGVSVTPTVAGSNLTLTANDGSGHAGSTTIATVQTQYAAWSGGALFDSDSNGDGISAGLAWALGAANPSANAIGLLPTFDASSDPDYFIYTYRRSDAANASATISVRYGSDLTGWTTAVHDGTNIIITPSDDFFGFGIDKVEVKIKRTLAVGGKLFARLKVEENSP